MANFVNKALIEKYLDNRCTPAETALVEAFIQQPEGEAMLDELLTERLPEDIQASTSLPDDEAKKALWSARIGERLSGERKRIRRMKVLRYAAVWAALLMGTGFFALYRYGRHSYNMTAQVFQEKKNPLGERSIIRLNDGSVIHLGSDSKLEYPEAFKGESREITLTGEAFFEIAEDPAHPFIIYTGNVQTTVLGTSFKIHAFTGSPLSVAVATGKVRVDHRDGDKLQQLAILTPGNEIVWDRHQVKLKTVAVADVEGWQKGRLVFNNKTLKEIAMELERSYNVKIGFKNKQKQAERLTVTLFVSSPLSQTLETLAAGSNFRYSINNRDIIIY
jgi:ferric-dicitrate binding protein FerR (iron transport regulator)